MCEGKIYSAKCRGEPRVVRLLARVPLATTNLMLQSEPGISAPVVAIPLFSDRRRSLCQYSGYTNGNRAVKSRQHRTAACRADRSADKPCNRRQASSCCTRRLPECIADTAIDLKRRARLLGLPSGECRLCDVSARADLLKRQAGLGSEALHISGSE